MWNKIIDFKKKEKYLGICIYASFLTLALVPVMKHSMNTISIVLCMLLIIIDIIINKRKIIFTKDFFLLTLIFWMFLLYSAFLEGFDILKTQKYVLFLIFPFIFWLKPPYIDAQVKSVSVVLFQISVTVASFYYLLFFLKANQLNDLFRISMENIPFFRDFIFRNAALHIHPTYFSVFLLISFTISFYEIIKSKHSKIKILTHILNIGFSIFLIFLFSSRIVIIAMVVTILILIISFLKKISTNKILITAFLSGITIFVFLKPFGKILSQRFEEVITDYKKPVHGNYHNSTNIRMAVLSCSLDVYHTMPFFGYGNSLQHYLDTCYNEKFESNFSAINQYNTHNYYINVLLYGGWLFLILFLGYILFLLMKLKYSILALLFIFQILLINLTENYFSRHYGIVTFNYFICLFYFFKNKKSIKTHTVL